MKSSLIHQEVDMRQENHLPNMALHYATRLSRGALQTKLRLVAGIAINATGAVVLIAESFRFLGSSL